jgi:hypothetical protein
MVADCPVPDLSGSSIESDTMGFFKRLIDFLTQGSERPVRRLVAYYLLVAVAATALAYTFPVVDRMFSGERLDTPADAPQLLQDGLGTSQAGVPSLDLTPRLELALNTMLICFGTLALMLPVSWVYMSTKRTPRHDQSVVQSLIILPIIVAGIILIVRNSLALAFSLAGVVSVLRFRTTLTDVRDIMFIFLGIAVGFAAGVQVLVVGVILSITFNFVLLFTWRYDFGRSVLEPTAASKWAEPLDKLAQRQNGQSVPDRDLVLALTPKKAELLTARFKRVGESLGSDAKRPRYNAILTITTNGLAGAQAYVELALDKVARRWKLDEVVTNEGKPSELYYLAKIRKTTSRDDVLTAIRTGAGEAIQRADLEIGDAGAREIVERKKAEKAENGA